MENPIKALDHAPKVACPGCLVEMTLRDLEAPKHDKNYLATYRCPKCGMDTVRHFRAD